MKPWEGLLEPANPPENSEKLKLRNLRPTHGAVRAESPTWDELGPLLAVSCGKSRVCVELDAEGRERGERRAMLLLMATVFRRLISPVH